MPGNVFSYLQWRGDLTLRQSPFNEVDNLILSTLSYLDFSGIVPAPGEGSVALQSAAESYFARYGVPDEPDPDLAPSEDLRKWMLFLMASTRRFCTMKLAGWVSILDPVQVKQFSAMTVLISRSQLYVAYRGTSDDLAGWKEDFLLACLPEVPSQEEAVSYLAGVASLYPGRRILTGGHSKGGNLAVYAAVQAPPACRERLDAVWCNDGPGFQERFLTTEAYQGVCGKIHSIVPKSSVVGMLLAHDESYQIVDSAQTGLLQHDGLSWKVMGDHFLSFPALTEESVRANRSIHAWMLSMPPEARREFVDALFEVLTSAGFHSVSEIRRDRIRAINASLPYLKELPKDTRDRIFQFLFLLNRVSRSLDEDRLLHEGIRRYRGR